MGFHNSLGFLQILRGGLRRKTVDKTSDLLTPQFSDHEQIHKKGNVAILKYNGRNQSK